MLNLPAIIGAIAIYIVVLVFVGWWANRGQVARSSTYPRALFYGLSLATLSSAWTYFGAVGDASNGSWLFVANALGPILAITLGFPIWRRIAQLSKQENVGSLADFLAARYGKSRTLGSIAACVASVGALPYIALQLTVLTHVWNYTVGSSALSGVQALLLITLLTALAILFGARRPSLTQHNRGFVSMIALESCVKLIGFVVVAALCATLIVRSPGGIERAVEAIPPVLPNLNLSFFTLTILCTVTAYTLPRQFHLGFVTLENVRDIKLAAWIVPAYFALWAIATLIIAIAVRSGFEVADASPTLQVLAVPMAYGGELLTLIVLLGGLSAGAAMVIVETTAISAMVSNELVLPMLASVTRRSGGGRHAGRSVLLVRRATIVAIGMLSWLYFLGTREAEGATKLGVTALTASAQLLPALVGGIYWRRGHAVGAIAGIAAGIVVWGVFIAGPAFFSSPGSVWRPGIDVLWPSISGWQLEVSVLTSLVLNTAIYILVSMRARPQLIDTIQADNFVASPASPRTSPPDFLSVTVGDLRNLLSQFIGQEETEKALLDFKIGSRVGDLSDDSPVSPTLARSAERLLAGVIGAPSARNVVAIALAADKQDAKEISRILDEAGLAVHFSRELLQTTLDSLEHAVSVIDADLRLVAWNTRFLDLTGLERDQVYVGKPIVELLATRSGHRDQDAVRAYLTARLGDIARHTRLQDEFALVDGRVVRFTGVPLGDDEFLTTFVDITDLKQAEQVLAQSNEELEQRVKERTSALIAANEALASAKQVAERATSSQQRFVAAASHDLVQPLHAARLFIGNALIGLDESEPLRPLLERADQSVEGAHRLLQALLNLSQLETGVLQPKFQPVDAGALLASLAEEFQAQAIARGLELVVLPTRFWVRTDRDLLRSVLQNLILNAIRYTAKGRVVVAARSAGQNVRFEVRDSGVGIEPENLPAAFSEYSRLSEGRKMSEGAGLGLSIVARISQVLDHPVAVRSKPGRGSVFSIAVPRTEPAPMLSHPVRRSIDLQGLKVLCVDDERDVLVGTKALIERWGGEVTAVGSAEELEGLSIDWDVVIADYHLGGTDGLELLRRLEGKARTRLLITATPDEEWEDLLPDEGIQLFQKPIAPLVLQAALVDAAQRQAA